MEDTEPLFSPEDDKISVRFLGEMDPEYNDFELETIVLISPRGRRVYLSVLQAMEVFEALAGELHWHHISLMKQLYAPDEGEPGT